LPPPTTSTNIDQASVVVAGAAPAEPTGDWALGRSGAYSPGRSGTAWPTAPSTAFIIRFVPDRVVDLGNGPAGPERLGRHLGGHHVPVVALGQGQEQIGILCAGAAQGVLVRAIAPQRRSTER
jgi:hypothetical protein